MNSPKPHISIYVVSDDSLDGFAIAAIKDRILYEWNYNLGEKKSINKLAKSLGETKDRMYRLIKSIPGLPEDIGYTIDNRNRLCKK